MIFFFLKKKTPKETRKKKEKEKKQNTETPTWKGKLNTTWGNRKQEILMEISSD